MLQAMTVPAVHLFKRYLKAKVRPVKFDCLVSDVCCLVCDQNFDFSAWINDWLLILRR